MVDLGRDAAFTEYVTARSPWLRRVAYLMCQDWHRADDLVQTSITKLYVHWNRASHAENLDGYARATLVNTFLAEQRTQWWRRVAPRADAVEVADPSAADAADLDTSLDLRAALALVPPRQRAAIVLRYYCDMTDAVIHDPLRAQVRERAGRVEDPAASIMDTQSLHVSTSVPTITTATDANKRRPAGSGGRLRGAHENTVGIQAAGQGSAHQQQAIHHIPGRDRKLAPRETCRERRCHRDITAMSRLRRTLVVPAAGLDATLTWHATTRGVGKRHCPRPTL
jgi:RNA polymerase sigma factor (sigma-70 family)